MTGVKDQLLMVSTLTEDHQKSHIAQQWKKWNPTQDYPVGQVEVEFIKRHETPRAASAR